MLVTLQALRDFAETIATIALLAIAYGTLHRWFARRGLASLMLGLLFGLCAMFAMMNPLTLQPGVIVDLRSVPVALAATYLRPEGALAALAVAIGTRVWVGGIGLTSGVVGLLLTFATALLLGRLAGRAGSRSSLHLLALALACSSGLGGMLFLPWDIALGYLARIGPMLVLSNAVGFFCVAKIIEREQRIMTRESDLLLASNTDPLTQLLNRRGFEAAYARALDDRRTGRGSALMLLDMDHFKALNDTYGHDFGDRVLREVAHRLALALRRRDLIGRIGGEEMVVHMTGLSRDDALEAATRICHDIGQHPIAAPGGIPVRVTASIGVHWSPTPPDLAAALTSADEALYAAKREGRDRFVMAA
jgi:diguanylate cyclase